VILAVDFQSGIENAWSNVAAFVPKLAAALLILLVGWFVAKLVSRILDRILERVGFDRVVERGGLRQALARSKYDPSDILAKIVYWTIMLFVLQLAFGVFGANPISDLLGGLIAYLPNLFVAILIIVIAAAVARAVTDLLANLLSGMQGGQLIARGAGIAILVFAAFAAWTSCRSPRGSSPACGTRSWPRWSARYRGRGWRRHPDYAAVLGPDRQPGRAARAPAAPAGAAVGRSRRLRHHRHRPWPWGRLGGRRPRRGGGSRAPGPAGPLTGRGGDAESGLEGPIDQSATSRAAPANERRSNQW
jgi:Conserved TM helix